MILPEVYFRHVMYWTFYHLKLPIEKDVNQLKTCNVKFQKVKIGQIGKNWKSNCSKNF